MAEKRNKPSGADKTLKPDDALLKLERMLSRKDENCALLRFVTYLYLHDQEFTIDVKRATAILGELGMSSCLLQGTFMIERRLILPPSPVRPIDAVGPFLVQIMREIGKGGRCLAGPTRELWRRSGSWEDALGPDVG
jgi:hypothetical protein